MTITGPDFKLTPSNDTSHFFDLELLYTVKPKKGEARQEFKNAGYGMTLQGALRSVAIWRMENKYLNQDISIEQFFKEYVAEIKDLKKLCNFGLPKEEFKTDMD